MIYIYIYICIVVERSGVRAESAAGGLAAEGTLSPTSSSPILRAFPPPLSHRTQSTHAAVSLQHSFSDRIPYGRPTYCLDENVPWHSAIFH